MFYRVEDKDGVGFFRSNSVDSKFADQYDDLVCVIGERIPTAYEDTIIKSNLTDDHIFGFENVILLMHAFGDHIENVLSFGFRFIAIPESQVEDAHISPRQVIFKKGLGYDPIILSYEELVNIREQYRSLAAGE